jgi:hypothetical protein
MQTQPEFSQARLRLGVRYNFIVYPIDFAILQRVLTPQDYKVVKPPVPQDLISGGGILDVNGTVATKEDLIVDSLVDKQVIGINGSDTTRLLTAFEQLESGISNELGIQLQERARFYETILYFNVRTGNSPVRVFGNLGNRYPYHSDMSSLLGQEVSPISYRVGPANAPVDSENWFDFTIEPLLSRAASTYHVGFIFRNARRDLVIDILRNSKDKITQALRLLEST